MYKITQDLYHDPDCDHPIFSTPQIEAASELRDASTAKLEAEGYEACPHCLPELAED